MSVATRIIDRFSSTLSTAISWIRHVSSRLGPRDDWVEGLRRQLALRLDTITRPLGRPLVRYKGRADHCYTVDASSDRIEQTLHPTYQRNLSSTRKYRYIGGDGRVIDKDARSHVRGPRRDWAVGSWVYDPDSTNWQHHVYLFDNKDGATDVYAHREPSAEIDPKGHVSGRQSHGDPDGLVRQLLDEHRLPYVHHD